MNTNTKLVVIIGSIVAVSSIITILVIRHQDTTINLNTEDVSQTIAWQNSAGNGQAVAVSSEGELTTPPRSDPDWEERQRQLEIQLEQDLYDYQLYINDFAAALLACDLAVIERLRVETPAHIRHLEADLIRDGLYISVDAPGLSGSVWRSPAEEYSDRYADLGKQGRKTALIQLDNKNARAGLSVKLHRFADCLGQKGEL